MCMYVGMGVGGGAAFYLCSINIEEKKIYTSSNDEMHRRLSTHDIVRTENGRIVLECRN